MFKYVGIQSFLALIFFTLSCTQVAAQPQNGNMSNDVILKRPRRKPAPVQSDILLKKADFKSKNTHLNKLPKGIIQTPGGQEIKIYLAIDEQVQTKGLSGTKANQFDSNEGMLFFNLNYQPRSFWMPDTYFNLDIFFLNKDLSVINVERNVPFHPGRETPQDIYRTNSYNCWHVLELKHSALSRQIVTGSRLIWKSSPDLKKIEQDIRQGR